jgi:DNA-binding NtrC family response regulator
VIEPWLTGAVQATRAAAETNGHHYNGIVEPKPDLNGTSNGAVRPLEELEREAIVYALRRFNGHRQKTAIALGIGVRTLGLKLKKWKEMKLVAETL